MLDLFAGSGALGLEALSRGAAHVTFVEKDRRAAAAIEAIGARMAGEPRCRWRAPTRSPGWRGRRCQRPFDIVFLDPPYDCGSAGGRGRRAGRAQAARADARVYLERRAREPLPALPAGWQSIRDGRAGEVGYHLFSI